MTTSADTLTHIPAELAAALNEHFVRVDTQDDAAWPVPDLSHLPSPASNLSNMFISSEAVVRYIEKLPTGKSPGYDGTSKEILKALKLSISYPLSLIFYNSLSSGVFPAAWKYSVVVPRIYKNKGSRHDPGNYRPISLLNTCSKILERIVYDRLYHHLAPLLHDMQSGFRHGDSTSLHLTNLVQRLCTLQDRRHYLGLCFFDLAKAFDSVWHRGLLAKLHAYGVTGRLQTWLTSPILTIGLDKSSLVQSSRILSLFALVYRKGPPWDRYCAWPSSTTISLSSTLACLCLQTTLVCCALVGLSLCSPSYTGPSSGYHGYHLMDDIGEAKT
eukprot:scpid43282/ scgid32077/ Probable RNA-directed DNA polymerase from transposon BS; Reverse transcriptase